MLLTKEVNIKVFSKCSYYENLGYVFEKHIVGSHKKLMVSRNLIENINWRNLIFKRDNYKCKICENKKIEAHHLNSYTNYPQERFNINNGITLCKDCHKSYHKTKGYKNATKEKYEEYINEISCVSFN